MKEEGTLGVKYDVYNLVVKERDDYKDKIDELTARNDLLNFANSRVQHRTNEDLAREE